jgi:hypothetical protein
MGHPDGAHTHGGGGFDPLPILIVIGAIAVAGPVAAAAVELLHILLIAVVVILSLGAVGLVGFVAYRLRHRDTSPARAVYRAAPVAPPRVRALPEPRPAIEAPRQVHLHFHGVDVEEVAEIIRRQQE